MANRKQSVILDSFDKEIYERTSDNNMPIAIGFAPLTVDEQAQVERALVIA
jgi:hypothetical protein